MADVHIKIGKRKVGDYLSKILEEFSENNKVVVDYLEIRKRNAEILFSLLEKGGYIIGKLISDRQEYVKVSYAFNGEQSIDGKGGMIEFFPENRHLRIFGNPNGKVRNSALSIITKCGQKQNLVRMVFMREVYKRGF